MSNRSHAVIFNDAQQATGAEISHCRRVAVWSVELAKIISCTPEEQIALEHAALTHHLPASCNPAMRNKLLLALGIATPSIRTSSDKVHEILGAMHGRCICDPSSLRLAAVVELANALDERLEWESVCAEAEESDPQVDLAFERLQAVAPADIEKAVSATPPLPQTVQKCLDLLFRENVGAADVEAIAQSDPSMADLAQINSAINGAGVKTALRILCAASMRSLFEGAALHRVWNHGLRVAQVAECLARSSGEVDPAEAFVAGLLHDIGRLPMAALPFEFQNRFSRAFASGCEPALIERVFCSATHGQTGARLLRGWNLPAPVALAVEHHHEPDRSNTRLADLLCIADDPLGKHEDLPSVVRRRAALNRLKLPAEMLAHVTLEKTALETLRFAA